MILSENLCSQDYIELYRKNMTTLIFKTLGVRGSNKISGVQLDHGKTKCIKNEVSINYTFRELVWTRLHALELYWRKWQHPFPRPWGSEAQTKYQIHNLTRDYLYCKKNNNSLSIILSGNWCSLDYIELYRRKWPRPFS